MTPPADLVLRRGRLWDDRPLQDVVIVDGRITQIGEQVAATAGGQEIDCAGRVVSPGLVEAHLHLDKALLAERAPNRSGTLAEALAVTAALKASITAEDVRQRAEAALRLVLRHGTTAIRAETELDPVIGLSGIRVLLELKQRYAPLVDLQVVAFPQEGIQRAPGTEDLLWQALELGADVVGGVPYNDLSAERHIDTCFALARHFDRPLSFHQDFQDDAQGLSIEYLVQQTIAAGWQGRVTVGHATGWAALEPAALNHVIDGLLAADISVVTLPLTDLHLGGRGDPSNVRRALTPVRTLLEAGVNVAASTNNLRNAFTPFGSGDVLHAAALLVPAAHLGSTDLLPRVLDLVTTNAARAIGRGDRYGLRAGGQADLVVLDSERRAEVAQTVPERLYVIKSGRVTHTTTLHRQRLAEPLP